MNYLEQVILSTGFARDKYSNDPAGYLVNSIYFDNLNLLTYRDKQDGVANRLKLRLRYYGLSPEKFVFEVKKKASYIGLKDRFEFSRSDVEIYFNRQKGSINNFLNANFPGFVPTMYVGYKRKAFERKETSLRYSIDSNITWCLPPFDFQTLLSPKQSPLTPMNKFILEVKFSEKLPKDFQDLIKRFQLTWIENSKYANCLEAAIND